MSDGLLVSLISGSTGIVFILLAIPLIKGKIGPNMYYGFRTEKTMSNPKIWYPVNRIGGRDTCIAGGIIIITSIIFGLLNARLSWFSIEVQGWANAGVLFLNLAWMLLHFMAVLKRY